MYCLQIFRCCIDWLPARAWVNVSLAVAVGYFIIAKVELIKLLRKAPDNGMVMHRALHSPRRGVEAPAHQSSPETSSPTPCPEPDSAYGASPSLQPSREIRPTFAGATEQLNCLPDNLAALDWTSITCQNRQDCSRAAAYVVELHAVDHCSGCGTNSAGNVMEILCGKCLAELRKSISRHLARLSSRGQRPSCLTCGAPLELTTDILRSVTLLDSTVPKTVAVGLSQRGRTAPEHNPRMAT